MITVSSCCKCISLRTGAIVIGAIEIVWAFCYIGFALGGLGWSPYGVSGMIAQIVVAVYVCLWIIAGALLLAGVLKDKKKFILVYLIIIMILILLALISGLIIVIFHFVNKSMVNGIVMLIVFCFEAALNRRAEIEFKKIFPSGENVSKKASHLSMDSGL